MPQIEMSQEQYDSFMAIMDKKVIAEKRALARKTARREVLDANKAHIVARTEEIFLTL